MFYPSASSGFGLTANKNEEENGRGGEMETKGLRDSSKSRLGSGCSF